MPDLLDDSMPPAATRAWRKCGVGSVAAKLRLLGRVNDGPGAGTSLVKCRSAARRAESQSR